MENCKFTDQSTKVIPAGFEICLTPTKYSDNPTGAMSRGQVKTLEVPVYENQTRKINSIKKIQEDKEAESPLYAYF